MDGGIIGSVKTQILLRMLGSHELGAARNTTFKTEPDLNRKMRLDLAQCGLEDD